MKAYSLVIWGLAPVCPLLAQTASWQPPPLCRRNWNTTC
jgi:hypothetical protein